jgi:hypothetical protein
VGVFDEELEITPAVMLAADHSAAGGGVLVNESGLFSPLMRRLPAIVPAGAFRSLHTMAFGPVRITRSRVTTTPLAGVRSARAAGANDNPAAIRAMRVRGVKRTTSR